eukprot:SAG31_NODE_12689_length_924_cov_0.866667_2_plen_120_part_01
MSTGIVNQCRSSGTRFLLKRDVHTLMAHLCSVKIPFVALEWRRSRQHQLSKQCFGHTVDLYAVRWTGCAAMARIRSRRGDRIVAFALRPNLGHPSTQATYPVRSAGVAEGVATRRNRADE